jgi:hypothetical protein
MGWMRIAARKWSKREYFVGVMLSQQNARGGPANRERCLQGEENVVGWVEDERMDGLTATTNESRSMGRVCTSRDSPNRNTAGYSKKKTMAGWCHHRIKSGDGCRRHGVDLCLVLGCMRGNG